MKFLVFVMLCIVSVNCLELENLCSSDHFSYNGVVVNAFLKLRHNFTFEPLRHYLIDGFVTCDQSEFDRRKNNYREAIETRKVFNRTFTEFYTENLNNATAEEFGEKARRIAVDAWLPFKKFNSEENFIRCLEHFEQKASAAYYVFSTLERMFRFNSYPINDEAAYKPTNSEAIETLGKLFDELKTGADGQTFALKSEKALDFYFKDGFVLPREFKFLTEGRAGLDTKSMITLDQYFPFNNQHHEDTNCVSVKELPSFYKNKLKQ